MFNRFPLQALTLVAGNGCVARPDAGCRADWVMMAGRAWIFGGTLNPGLPPGATGGRPSATGFRNASAGCDGWSEVSRFPVVIPGYASCCGPPAAEPRARVRHSAGGGGDQRGFDVATDSWGFEGGAGRVNQRQGLGGMDRPIHES